MGVGVIRIGSVFRICRSDCSLSPRTLFDAGKASLIPSPPTSTATGSMFSSSATLIRYCRAGKMCRASNGKPISAGGFHHGQDLRRSGPCFRVCGLSLRVRSLMTLPSCSLQRIGPACGEPQLSRRPNGPASQADPNGVDDARRVWSFDNVPGRT